MIGSDRGYQTLSRPSLLWQDNWFETWKWFESFLQLHRPSLFDWAGLQTPPEERGGGLEQWGRVGYLVWHLYTFNRQLVSSQQMSDDKYLSAPYPELSCSPPSPSDYWNFCPFSSVLLLDFFHKKEIVIFFFTTPFLSVKMPGSDSVDWRVTPGSPQSTLLSSGLRHRTVRLSSPPTELYWTSWTNKNITVALPLVSNIRHDIIISQFSNKRELSLRIMICRVAVRQCVVEPAQWWWGCQGC